MQKRRPWGWAGAETMVLGMAGEAGAGAGGMAMVGGVGDEKVGFSSGSEVIWVDILRSGLLLVLSRQRRKKTSWRMNWLGRITLVYSLTRLRVLA